MIRKLSVAAMLASFVIGCAPEQSAVTEQRGNLEATSHFEYGHVLVSEVLEDGQLVLSIHYDPSVGEQQTWIAGVGNGSRFADAPASLDEANRNALAVYEGAKWVRDWLASMEDYEEGTDVPRGDGCDPGDWGNECATDCCDNHDKCYEDCGCTGAGWWCRLQNPFSACLGACDVNVAVCLGGCVVEVFES